MFESPRNPSTAAHPFACKLKAVGPSAIDREGRNPLGHAVLPPPAPLVGKRLAGPIPAAGPEGIKLRWICGDGLAFDHPRALGIMEAFDPRASRWLRNEDESEPSSRYPLSMRYEWGYLATIPTEMMENLMENLTPRLDHYFTQKQKSWSSMLPPEKHKNGYGV
ncbi:hypothetical protein Cgig2_030149 [Carnegiea gigantea]|uniref:Uncharacterized protein n=1 Tax=Carnegiea gigantea TaxID=171969 RepID=A0A9Q1K152_9CARY|nr:hypothetical protein Cgig2_030149 [Carnegiea gigantea]